MARPVDVFVVDAFVAGPFTGNPAGVCLLESPAPAQWMQALASELNQAETAFLSPGHRWGLRWFTPVIEVPLCGHATLAAAHILYETRRAADVTFETRSGQLVTTAGPRGISIRLPVQPLETIDPTEVSPLLPRVGIRWAGRTKDRGLGDVDYLAVLDSEDEVRSAVPDLAKVAKLHVGLILTAPGETFDCVSRYFAPAWGIPEDSVTGVAHCALAPYWSARLGKRQLRCYQASPRGGSLEARVEREFVILTGRATTVVRGQIEPSLMMHD